MVLVFISVAIFLDCAWSANGGRKEKIGKSQVGNEVPELYFGFLCSTVFIYFLLGERTVSLDQAVIPLDLTQPQ